MGAVITSRDVAVLNEMFGTDIAMWPADLRRKVEAIQEADRVAAEMERRKREDADRRAAAELMGEVVQKDAEAPRLTGSGNVALWATTIPSSSGNGEYTVEERPDTVNGGTYLWCSCPAWPFQRGKGNDCKHVRLAAAKRSRGLA